MRLTKKSDKLGYCLRHSSIKTWQCWDKLGQLEDIEEELGIDLVEFLTECKHVLKNANHVIGYTSKGIEVKTDFGYVDQFIDEMKKALTKEELK